MHKKTYFPVTSVLVLALIISLLSQSVLAMPTASAPSAEYKIRALREKLASLTNLEVSKACEKFSDVPKHWASPYIGKLTSLEIISGMPDGTFRPDKAISADEYITLVVRALGYKLEQEEKYWAQVYIDKAKEDNIIDKEEIKDFKLPLTRELAAKILVKAVMLFETAPNSNVYNYIRGQIKDYPDIGDHGKQYVLQAYAMGLFAGNTQGLFNPNSNLTRAEASAIIIRLLDLNERIPMKPDKSEVLLLKDILGNEHEIYPPDNIELFNVIKALNSSVNTSKGYAFLEYNPFGQIVTGNFYNDREASITDEFSIHMGFSVHTANNSTMEFPYAITVFDPENVQKLHRDVVEDAFKVLFEQDTKKAMEAFDKYIALSLNQNNPSDEWFTLNRRKIRIYRVAGEERFSIWIYFREKSF